MKNKLLSSLIIFFSLISFSLAYSQEIVLTAEEVVHSHEDKNPFHVGADDSDHDHFIQEFVKMMTTLGILVSIVLIATWYLKRMMKDRVQQMNTSSLVKIIEQRMLTPKTTIYILDIQGKGMVIAESANGVTPLGAFEEKDQKTT